MDCATCYQIKKRYFNVFYIFLKFYRVISLANEGGLKIEEILPYFPDFTVIDELKDHLIKALNAYDDRLSVLNSELDEAVDSSANIRQDIKKLKKRYFFLFNVYRHVSIPVTKTCDISGEFLFTGMKFFVFPCAHAFKYDALLEEVSKDRIKAIKITDIKQKLQNVTSSSERETLELEIESLLSSQCPLCSEIMIKSIDIPLTTIIDSL